ncbi:MAG: cytochrome c biogenesis protein CcsA [Magnetovibrio sp.]|nr:cytochrome c biogenesis protein CcsA [Magnetovibrio sp.]
MSVNFIHGLVAIFCLFPVGFMAFRGEARSDFTPNTAFWACLALSALGPLAWVLVQLSGTWQAGLTSALWVSIAATMTLFAMLAWSVRETWRLTPLLVPYMALMGLVALLAEASGRGEGATIPPISTMPTGAGAGPDGWLIVHIVISVATYALVTISAVAALAAFLQDRALKTKRPTKLTHKLPSVADCGSMTVRLLGWGEAILGLGLITGMAAEYKVRGTLLVFDHKTILSILAFVVIGGVLFAHHKTGLRGRKAARYVLLGYLLLALGYIGVKVVTDVILA